MRRADRIAVAEPADPLHAVVRVRLNASIVASVFEADLQRHAHVQSAWTVAGDFDYEIHLTCPTMAELTAVLRALRGYGADRTDTALLLREIVGHEQSALQS